jgi:hypothetical protein
MNTNLKIALIIFGVILLTGALMTIGVNFPQLVSVAWNNPVL